MATGGAETAMKSVIAQLGERQQMSSKGVLSPSERPSPAAKPQPVVAKKPAVNAKPPASGIKPGNKRPPITAHKPACTVQPGTPTDLPGPPRQKPTVAPKSPAAATTPSVSAVDNEDDPVLKNREEGAVPVPPWQSLVRKKNAPPTPTKNQTISVTQTRNGADRQFSVGSSTSYDAKQTADCNQQPDDSELSAAAKMRTLKQAFEGASQEGGQSVGTSGAGGTLKKVDGTQDNTVQRSALDQRQNDEVDIFVASPSPKSTDDAVSPPPRLPASDSDRSTAVSEGDIVVAVDGQRYRRLPPPPATTRRPGRKPAMPPLVDLAPFKSFAAAAIPDAVDDEIYDDATAVAVPPTPDVRGVTLRSGGGAAARRNTTASSVVSQISEYTEEEEEMERRLMCSKANGGDKANVQAMSESSDDIYDDVVASPATDQFNDDEIYEELD